MVKNDDAGRCDQWRNFTKWTMTVCEQVVGLLARCDFHCFYLPRIFILHSYRQIIQKYAADFKTARDSMSRESNESLLSGTFSFRPWAKRLDKSSSLLTVVLRARYLSTLGAGHYTCTPWSAWATVLSRALYILTSLHWHVTGW